MRYIPPRRPKRCVIYSRTGSDVPAVLTAELQERVCRSYCAQNSIPISHTVRINCESEESLDVLRYVLRTLPKNVDSVFAAQFFLYSRDLPELGKLCLLFQCHPAWVYSLDLVEPISKVLPMLLPADYDLADQRYLELVGKPGRGFT